MASHSCCRRRAPNPRAWAPIAAATFLLVAAANAFAVAYVSTEHYIYYWDWSFYWLNFETLGELARSNPFAALATVSSSIRYYPLP